MGWVDGYLVDRWENGLDYFEPPRFCSRKRTFLRTRWRSGVSLGFVGDSSYFCFFIFLLLFFGEKWALGSGNGEGGRKGCRSWDLKL